MHCQVNCCFNCYSFNSRVLLNQQVLGASITWKQCAALPKEITTGKTTVINGMVYCGGGETNSRDTMDYVIFCYDLAQDKWTTLPPLPVKWFGLGQVNGNLVAVGGLKRNNDTANVVYTYDKRSQKWKQTIHPMPTVRWSTSVLSLPSALIVAGGISLPSYYIDAVEIFQSDTSQWYTTDPLPTSCCNVSLTVITMHAMH